MHLERVKKQADGQKGQNCSQTVPQAVPDRLPSRPTAAQAS